MDTVVDYQTGEIIVAEPDTNEWYDALVEECKAIIVEAKFTSRWALVEGYHLLGERIVTDQNYQWHAKGNMSYFQDLGNKIGVSKSTLYYAIQFYEKYPDLSLVPEGKAISWNKIVTKYLPEPEQEEEPTQVPITQAYGNLAFEMILNAINDNDGEWLLSSECSYYFETLDLPYDPIKDWAKSGCKTINEMLCGLLRSRYKPANTEDADDI